MDPRLLGAKSFLYIPDEPRLRARAYAIVEQRRHSLRHDDRELTRQEPASEPIEAEQVSLFAPISATPLGDAGDPDWVLDGELASEPAADAALTVALPPLPVVGRGVQDGRTRREHKERLRKASADKGRLIAHHTGLTHAGVNAELNRVSGVKKVSEATVEQLERRLDKAETWLTRASARRVPG
ncbi:MAG: hypothetical protein M3163_11360 [Actinomycetota bacterium]|nr:hypothetical protein [Actinomycetota bacterium]